jgi:hypothetical protein
MTYVYTRESLASLFRAAADALQTPSEPAKPSAPGGGGFDYAQALETYVTDHSHQLGNLAAWCRKKYAAEPTPAKAKSLLAYAQKQVEMVKANPGPEPRV